MMNDMRLSRFTEKEGEEEEGQPGRIISFLLSLSNSLAGSMQVFLFR
jgi:hypothetical protein